jgi:hypothetical protein
MLTAPTSCPPDKALIVNTLILNRLGVLIDSTLAENIEHGSFALGDSLGAITIGPVIHGTDHNVPGMAPPPSNACMALHAHPFDPQKWMEGPSGTDLWYGSSSGFKIVQMIVTNDYIYFVDTHWNARVLGRRQH